MTEPFTCVEPDAEVFARAHGHTAGQQFAGLLEGVERGGAVGGGVHLHGSDFDGRVQGGGGVVNAQGGRHGAERESALLQGKRLAAVTTAGQFRPRLFAGLGLEAVAQALVVGVDLGHDLGLDLRGLGTNEVALGLDGGKFVSMPVGARPRLSVGRRETNASRRRLSGSTQNRRPFLAS